MNNYKNLLDRHHKYLRYLLVLSFITFVILVAATSAQGANCLSVDGVSSGTTVNDTDISMTISHTTGSGSDRLMLVGISYLNNGNETVTGVTYGGTALTKVGEINNSDDSMVYIYASISPSDGSVVSPDPGTANVVITFNSALDFGAIAGVMTFTGVHQTTPLGTFASTQGDNTTSVSLDIDSAPGELVFGVAACEYDAFTTASSGQYEHWNTTISGGDDTNGAGGIDGGASTVTMTWDLDAEATPYNHWAMGGVSIKPATAGAKKLVMVVGSDDSQPYDAPKQALFESWGWTVGTINESDSQTIYNNAPAAYDVMYISESVSSGAVNTKATILDIGIVVDEHWVWDDMNFFSSGDTGGYGGTSINITDNNHYITSPFSTGSLSVYNSTANLATLPYTLAGEGQLLATAGGDPTLFAFDTGDNLSSGTAVNRRVGFSSFDSGPSNWTPDFDSLLERSLDWAAGCAGGGGGGNQPPVADVGGPYSATVGTPVVLDGSGSSDPEDGQPVTAYSWSLTVKPGGSSATLQNPTTVNPSFVPDVAGDYTLQLIVQDSNSEWSESVEIIITANPAGSVDVSGYSCNMKITIKASEVAGDLNYFPVLIDVTDESLKTSGCGFVTDPDADDLIFTNSAQSLQLDHEIEKYDGGNGELVAWVEIPFLSGSTNTEIYMYYGDSNVTTPQENPTGVWDEDGNNNYVGVWHLHDDYADSTTYSNDGSPSGMSHDPGAIADGGDFDGNDQIALGDPASLQFQEDTDFCISAWINASSTSSNMSIVGQRRNTSIVLGVNNSNGDRIYSCMDDNFHNSDNGISSGQWYHVALCYDYISGTTGNSYMYIDGAPQSNNPVSHYNDISPTDDDWFIGYEYRFDEYFSGDIDEVRMSNTVRSADWIQTSYSNQNSPSSFYDTEVQCPSQVQPEDFSCSMDLTIDYTKVAFSSATADFPVLISLTDDALKGTGNCGFVSNSNGYDIMFTDSNDNQLDHEIEEYDGTAGELVAWVKTTVSPTVDDPQNIIRMYYGNSNVCGSLENPAGVWDSNYAAVWHLAETVTDESTGGTHYDSTSNSNDGSQNDNDDADGKIAGGQMFDGSSDWIQVPNSASLDITGDEITLSAWVKMTAGQSDDAGIINKSYSNNYNYMLNVQDSDVGDFRVKTPSGTTYLDGSTTLNVGQWYFLYGIYNGSTARVYLDDSQDGTDNRTGNIESSAPAPVNLGRRRTYPTADDRFFTGVIDEARISNVARSVDWMKTEYNNQSDPLSFYTVTNNTCSIPEPNPADFRCWRPITIDEQYVTGSDPLENFPLLIKINSDPLLETSNPPVSCGKVENSNGYDIIFTDEYGTELLDHEVETYDSGTGKLIAWVRIPSLSASSNTVIRMYYGNENIGCPTEKPTEVWDSNYMGVWHLSDTSGDTQDSTSYATGGNLSGSVSRGSSGRIYNSFNFGSSGEVDWGDPSHLDAGTGELTISLWANIDNRRGVWEQLIRKGMSSWGSGYQIEVNDTSDNLGFNINDGSTEWGVGAPSLWFSDDTWMYVVGVVDRTNNRLRIYKDGDEIGSPGSDISGIDNINSNSPLTIGNGWPDARIEEVRISNTDRSAEWIKAEWYNQRGSVQFYTIGDDSCESEYKYQYCQKITVDHNKVLTSISEYPLLVKITQEDLKWVDKGGLVENEFGYDIAFKDDNCNVLPYEIESYDKDTGALVAWVQTDISSSSDTEVYMYYGNSYIDCPSDNPTGVWNSNYQAVYHLNDNALDSTSNDRDGNPSSGVTYTAGKLGKGALFDPNVGGYDYIDIDNWSVSGEEMTIQAWVYAEDFGQNDPRIISKANGSSEDNHVFMLGLGSTDEKRMRLRIRATDGWWVDDCWPPTCDPAVPGHMEYDTDTHTLVGDSPEGDLTAKEWSFLAGVYNDDSSDEMMMYRDYGMDAGVRDHGGDLVTNSWDVWIGANPSGSDNNDYSWDGVLDEIRILNIELSQNRLRTEHNNMDDPSSFYSLGTCTRAISSVTSEWREEFQ